MAKALGNFILWVLAIVGGTFVGCFAAYCRSYREIKFMMNKEVTHEKDAGQTQEVAV